VEYQEGGEGMIPINNDSWQKEFLMMKLNSDMSPAATDIFIPLIVKELGEIKAQELEGKDESKN
jgi:hypothetical protein